MTDLIVAPTRQDQRPSIQRRLSTVIWLWPVLVMLLVPGLYMQWVIRVHAFRLPQFLDTTAIVGVVTLLIFLGVHLTGARRLRRSLSVTAILVLSVFLWPLFTAVGEMAARVTGLGFMADPIPVLVVSVLVWLAIRLGEDAAFAALTGVGVSVFAVGMLVGMGDRFVSPSAAPLIPNLAAAPAASTDVVVLVLDEYGRSDVLAEVYGLDNGDFVESLVARDFIVPQDAMSNYNHTFASLSSMLDLSYPFATGSISQEVWARTRVRLSGSNALFDTFHEHGYEVAFFENAWGGSNCTAAMDRCVRDGLTASDAWRLGATTILRPLVSRYLPTPFQRQGLQHLRALGEVVTAAEPGELWLTFAHITLPHAPLTLDEDCEFTLGRYRESPLIEGEPGEAITAKRAALAGQLACVNDTVLEQIDAILAADPDTIVVVTGDHGPEAIPIDGSAPMAGQEEALRARFGIVLALRLPSTCDPLPFRTPVNAIRIAVDCALGTDLGVLEDRWFVTPAEALEGPVVEVGYSAAG